jgi:hypothetical protein
MLSVTNKPFVLNVVMPNVVVLSVVSQEFTKLLIIIPISGASYHEIDLIYFR